MIRNGTSPNDWCDIFDQMTLCTVERNRIPISCCQFKPEGWVQLTTEKDLCRKEHLGTKKDFYLSSCAIKMFMYNVIYNVDIFIS